MNYRLKLALGCILAVTALPSYGADLLEVYRKAQQSDPAIREADATRLANREARPQAWAGLLPQITGSASYEKSDTDSSGTRPITFNQATGDPIFATSTGSDESTTKGWSLTLNQTIFSWDRWAGLQRADLQVAQAEAAYRAAQQDLIVRVIARYFAVLYAKDIVDTNEAALAAFSRQLEQSEKRFEVGLIAITDVQESRAQRDRASANLIDAKRTLATNIELLRELTGEEIVNLAAPKQDMPLDAPSPATVDQWIEVALDQNLNLTAARLSADIAAKNVSVARSGHAPSLSLSARYSDTDRDTDTISEITDPPAFANSRAYNTTSNSDGATVSLNLNVPIFSSGATQSAVRQAVYTHRAARERVERTTRETERSVRDSFLGVLSNISRVQALRQALESSRTSLQATEAGFEVGTRTTVDVLLSQNAFFGAQAEYYKSRYDYIQTRVQLELAAGQLSADDLTSINGYLNSN